jgi:NADH dehydrogenase [ubiquinone] 1 alpha subcomplex assembly factor 7
MSDIEPLENEIRRRIAAAGPMPVAEYMGMCLSHYYTTGDPIGARGDFITAPEVSQMFGELIGLWLATVWQQLGSPENVRLIELGPGRGTLMSDALRATKIVPRFHAAIVVHLVEINPLLKAQQDKALAPLGLPVYWHGAFADVPGGPALIVANEFFDALPINQAVKTAQSWHERQVGVDAAGDLAFMLAPEPIPHFAGLLPDAVRGAPEQSIFEWRADGPAMDLGRRIARDGGGALIIDYGHGDSSVGDTLQAVSSHAFADALRAPGAVDLTAHVDFAALGDAAEAMGAKANGPVTQGQFLRRLGIEARAQALKAGAGLATGAKVDAALERLIGSGPRNMGMLFKALAVTQTKASTPPGFEPNAYC